MSETNEKPLPREPAVGRLAVCSIGYIGRISGRANKPWGEAWVGSGIVTGQPWSSRNPVVLSEQDEAFVNALAAARAEVERLKKVEGVLQDALMDAQGYLPVYAPDACDDCRHPSCARRRDELSGLHAKINRALAAQEDA